MVKVGNTFSNIYLPVKNPIISPYNIVKSVYVFHCFITLIIVFMGWNSKVSLGIYFINKSSIIIYDSIQLKLGLIWNPFASSRFPFWTSSIINFHIFAFIFNYTTHNEPARYNILIGRLNRMLPWSFSSFKHFLTIHISFDCYIVIAPS